MNGSVVHYFVLDDIGMESVFHTCFRLAASSTEIFGTYRM